MKPEIREQWRQALLSEKYGQREDYLRGNNDYCCLGVLCDLAQQSGVGSWESYNDPDPAFCSHAFRAQGEKRDAQPPDGVLAWAGVQLEDYDKFRDLFVCLNDNYHWSFEQIAQELESEVFQGEGAKRWGGSRHE